MPFKSICFKISISCSFEHFEQFALASFQLKKFREIKEPPKNFLNEKLSFPKSIVKGFRSESNQNDTFSQLIKKHLKKYFFEKFLRHS